MTNADQPAFAVSKEMCEMPNGKINIEEYPFGLTKREYFAGLAMQGLMVQAIAGNHNSNNEMNNNYTAEHAVAMADALLNALSK